MKLVLSASSATAPSHVATDGFACPASSAPAEAAAVGSASLGPNVWKNGIEKRDVAEALATGSGVSLTASSEFLRLASSTAKEHVSCASAVTSQGGLPAYGQPRDTGSGRTAASGGGFPRTSFPSAAPPSFSKTVPGQSAMGVGAAAGKSSALQSNFSTLLDKQYGPPSSQTKLSQPPSFTTLSHADSLSTAAGEEEESEFDSLSPLRGAPCGVPPREKNADSTGLCGAPKVTLHPQDTGYETGSVLSSDLSFLKTGRCAERGNRYPAMAPSSLVSDAVSVHLAARSSSSSGRLSQHDSGQITGEKPATSTAGSATRTVLASSSASSTAEGQSCRLYQEPLSRTEVLLNKQAEDFEQNPVEGFFADDSATFDFEEEGVFGQDFLHPKVKDGLFIGNQFVAGDRDFLAANKITHVINCSCLDTSNFFAADADLQISYLSLPWPEQGTLHRLLGADGLLSKEIFNFIETSQALCEGCLVHSVRGHSRAATVLLAYLMQKYSWSLSKAKEFFTSPRPGLDMRAEHIEQLQQLERSLSRVQGVVLSKAWTKGLRRSDGDEELLLANTYLNSLLKTDLQTFAAEALPPGSSEPAAHTAQPDMKKRALRWLDEERPGAPAGDARPAQRQGTRKSILKSPVTSKIGSGNSSSGCTRLNTGVVSVRRGEPGAQTAAAGLGAARRRAWSEASSTGSSFASLSPLRGRELPHEVEKAREKAAFDCGAQSLLQWSRSTCLADRAQRGSLHFSPKLATAPAGSGTRAASSAARECETVAPAQQLNKEFSLCLNAVSTHKPSTRRVGTLEDSGRPFGPRNLVTARLSGGAALGGPVERR
ncbi:dual specificity phosphatase, catalytic domain-containing protein [Besnoitia besnoiti]|uniref:Dual specificity phosphatase, catalytic domain-containing protein n=1 Tax=Besnoitia besnoiti TaxID=94643 RepID=A0A2A9MFH4_BESBE|nr:dual specificity phosphatase, catalytic domain-containing protein [Besnoitia besnoiti]PFH34130.1 dual specificity phosphatase, catalytic domain-containing protein [Besnoitia besnoiti]